MGTPTGGELESADEIEAYSLSDEVRAALDLEAQDRIVEAIDQLASRVAQTPNDHYAVRLQADCLLAVGRTGDAFELVDASLAVTPHNPLLLSAKSRLLSGIGRHEESLQFVRMGTESFKLHPVGIGSTSPAQFLLQLHGDEWYQLHYLGRHAEALAVAQMCCESDPAMWLDKLRTSLVATGQTAEAEKLFPPSAAVDAPWDIAFELVYLNRYGEAIPFLQRRIAYVSKPSSSGFVYLLAYMECLLHSGGDREFELLSQFWLKQRLNVLNKASLAALSALSAYKGGDQAAGREQLRSALQLLGANRSFSRLRANYAFECTGESIAQMLE